MIARKRSAGVVMLRRPFQIAGLEGGRRHPCKEGCSDNGRPRCSGADASRHAASHVAGVAAAQPYVSNHWIAAPSHAIVGYSTLMLVYGWPGSKPRIVGGSQCV